MSASSFHRILCATDLSECSRRALGYGAALAGWSGARLALLHAAATPGLRRGGTPPHDAWPSEPRLEALRRFADPVIGTAAARLVVREGEPAEEIAAEAGRWGADLVIVGTHGRRGLEHWELGSVAEDVIRTAPCSVLTVPRNAPPPPAAGAPPFQNILCALDLGPASEGLLEAALALSIRAGAGATVLHALEDVREDTSRMSLRLGAPWFAAYRESAVRQAAARLRELLPEEVRAACRVEEVLVPGRAARQIVRLARARGADLVVMGAHAARPLQVTLFGSTAARVVREAPCPVLTVPPRVRARAAQGGRLAVVPAFR
jgi:nucleotide-binding universal stress UspA family protein